MFFKNAYAFKQTGLALILGTASLFLAEPAKAEVTALKQAIAEAASDERDIAAFYRNTGFEPLWTAATEEGKARRSALIAAMEAAPRHGLPADRYDVQELLRIMGNVRSHRDRGFAEVAITKAFVQLARDMQSGILQPSAVDDEIKRKVVYEDAQVYLTGLSESRPRAFFRSITPQTREYAELVKQKLQLENIVTSGGWGPKVQADRLELGDSGPAVVALRDRLIAMGYLDRSATQNFDRGIERGVQMFQASHGLEADGKVGPATLREINQEPEARLRSVIVAMERERWLTKERGERHILVNLTDFSARILDDDVVTFETRSVIGANDSDRRSPEFSDVMEHLIINPTWHVPRSITVNEYLPQLQQSAGAVGHLKFFDRGGREVSRSAINFASYDKNSFPFLMKQLPSSSNALGLVKFMFPNKHNIYLHDTPQKHLFARERRAFSHGCIRLADPFDFAYALLAKQEDDPVGFFQRILDTGQETQVDLKVQVPVHLIYRTAFTNAKGEPQFRRDVYGRDAKIWNALVRAGVSSEVLGAQNQIVAAVAGDPVTGGSARPRSNANVTVAANTQTYARQPQTQARQPAETQARANVSRTNQAADR